MDKNKAEDSPEDFPKGRKIIRIACEKDLYTKAMDDNQEFKSMLGDHIKIYPELFPAEIHNGYSRYGKGRCSKKLDNLQFKRIKIKTTGALLRNLWSHIPGTIQLRLKLSGMPRLVILFKIPAPISPSFF
ncbi:hypothetical protein GW537_17820 (plasmid) [Piscirickettsia salmonis]|uniref:Uncharacterized protein n=1 Tax=Piscirickettsia salmonis TaxID=1238 RepID=A0AAC8VL83_PISSA|nr:hypothetical protein [Piscirickettsia salmonis]ALB24475.1 hypothetical protein KU39_3p13 [Piscirickettsia salmonis]KLV34215.1 hypothetical protein AB894_15220 [Piscirickettsia salmonis]QGO14557.1 hypothetical protein Psal010b_03311 [Piscirickettsia salmonis]QGO71797.1 hypothetical protein Psal081_03310 [Piscirickettsia salmonis]QGO75363.1 hypothetical protein Psal098_03398 [Piscirickettsia salmonis]